MQYRLSKNLTDYVMGAVLVICGIILIGEGALATWRYRSVYGCFNRFFQNI